MSNWWVFHPPPLLKNNFYVIDDINALLEVLLIAHIRYQLATLLTISTENKASGVIWATMETYWYGISADIFNDIFSKKEDEEESGTEGSTQVPYLKIIK